MAASLEGYYSFAAGGSFFVAGLSSEYTLEEAVSIAPSVSLGWNEGYLADAHFGFNDLTLGVEMTWQFSERAALVTSIAHGWGLDRDARRFDGDSNLRDFFYGGAKIRITAW